MGGAAGVVDQHVQAPAALDDGCHQALQLVHVAHVAGQEQRLAPAMGRQALRRVAATDHHLRPPFEEALADTAPHTLAAPGHQYHLAAEIHRVAHGCLVCRSSMGRG
ncbi:hypothetical protein D3C85_1032520 [compost metagenome]